MAKINNVEIKSVKKTRGHEGETVAYGDVYIDRKKVGSFAQSTHGGPTDYDFNTEELQMRAKEYQSGLPESYQYKDIADDIDCFIDTLVLLKDMEKEAKRNKKEEKMTLAILARCQYSLIGVYQGLSDEQTIEQYGKVIEKAKKSMILRKREKAVLHIFRDLGEFNITVNAEQMAPEWLLTVL